MIEIMSNLFFCLWLLFFRGSYQRLGTAVAAFLQYQRICSSFSNGYSSETSEATRNWQDLDIYSMKKFLEDLIGPLTVPSHKRYIEYFSGLLSGDIKLNSLAINLKFIKMESPPCLHHNASLNDSEWRSFIKIFECERCVFISGEHDYFFCNLLKWFFFNQIFWFHFRYLCNANIHQAVCLWN